MAPRAALIKKADLSRIAETMQAAGVEEWRVEIDPGTGRVVIATGTSASTAKRSDWD